MFFQLWQHFLAAYPVSTVSLTLDSRIPKMPGLTDTHTHKHTHTHTHTDIPRLFLQKEYILDFTWTLLDKASKKVILRNLTQQSGFILSFPLPSPCLAMSQTGVLEAILCPWQSPEAETCIKDTGAENEKASGPRWKHGATIPNIGHQAQLPSC